MGRHREVAGLGGWAGRCRDAQVPAGVWKGSGCGGVSPRPTPAAPHLPAGLGGDLEGGLESSSLLRCEDGPGPLGPPRVLPVVPTALALAALSLGRLHVPILILTLHCGGHDAAGQPYPQEPAACWGPVTSCQHLAQLPRGLQGKDRPLPSAHRPCFISSLISALWGDLNQSHQTCPADQKGKGGHPGEQAQTHAAHSDVHAFRRAERQAHTGTGSGTAEIRWCTHMACTRVADTRKGAQLR